MHGHIRVLVASTVVLVTAALEAKVASFWEDLPPLPAPRQEVGVTALGEYVYVIGGILENTAPTGAVERFHVYDREWIGVAPLPGDVRLHHIGAASAGGLVFAIGGLDGSFRGVASVFALDPDTGEWTPRADLLRARGGAGVAVLDDRIFVAGGQDGGVSFDDLSVYDVATDQWQSLSPMPTARNHLAAVAVDDLVYAVGGRRGGLFGELEVYSPQLDRWETLAPLPTPRAGIAAAAVDDWIFVFGGEGNIDDLDGIFPQVEGFNTCRGTWHADEDMPNPRHGIGAAVVDGLIYIPGGAPVQGFGVTDVVDAFYPGSLGGGFGAFLRGDANLDAAVDISDASKILLSIFLFPGTFPCPDAADANDDGNVNISDAQYVLNFLFLGGPPTPAPGPFDPGFDPTVDGSELCLDAPPVPCVDPFSSE